MDIQITENMIMLGKLTGFPKWPCVVVNENDIIMKDKPDEEAKWYVVQFFNDGKYAWMTKKDLSSYKENVNFVMKTNSKNRELLIAIRDADNQLSLKSENPDHWIKVSRKRKIREKTLKRRIMKKEEQLVINMKKEHEPFEYKHDISNQNKETIGIIVGEVLAVMGEEITKNLLSAGFSVNFYSTMSDKCNRLVRQFQGVGKIKMLLSARAVLVNSSKVFLCLSEESQVKKMIEKNFEADNLSFNIIQSKGIINATSVTPDVSLELNKIVERNGGKYLEIAMIGSKTHPSNGNLTLLASGHIDFFKECLQLLGAIGMTAYHIDGDVGNTSKINLVLQMIKGVQLATLGTSFSLLESLGVPNDVFTKILEDTELASKYVIDKANSMQIRKFSKVEEPVDYIQEQLKLCIEMGYKVDHPMSLAHSAHQMFKHCNMMKYGGHDASAICLLNPFRF